MKKTLEEILVIYQQKKEKKEKENEKAKKELYNSHPEFSEIEKKIAQLYLQKSIKILMMKTNKNDNKEQDINQKSKSEINELEKEIKMLEEIKIQSENKNKDKLLIERANRIYSEISSSEIRSYISGYLEQYEMILKTDNKIRIKKAKKEFSEFLDKVDPELSDLNIDEILKDKEVKKEMEIEEDDDNLGFLN